MKQEFVLPAVLLFAVASGCSSGTPSASITAPDIIFEQEVGPAQVNYPEGPIEVKFNIHIQNRWTEPMTAVRVRVATLNLAGGPYSLRRELHNLQATIPPGEARVVSFWARGYGYGRNVRSAEPVSIQAVVYFETPKGTYQKIVTQELPQEDR